MSFSLNLGMRFVVILIICITLPAMILAQYGFEYRQKLGFLIAHRSLMDHLPEAPAVAGEFSVVYQTQHEKSWHSAYRQPLVGATLFYGSVGNNSILGKFMGLYGSVELPIIKYKAYRMDFRFGTGVGYTNRPFDPILNPQNVAIGSKINAMMCFAFKQSLRFANQGITLGIDMTHFSNASFQMPNLGINVPYISLGVQHYFKQTNSSLQKELSNKGPVSYGISGIFSAKEMRPVGVGRYPVYAMNFFGRRYFTPKFALEASLDIIYKKGLLSHPSYPNASPFDPLQIGFFIGYVQPFDRLHFIYGVGTYLRDVLRPDVPVYIRLGSRYALTSKLEAMMTLKTHFAKADYMEFGLMYHLNQ
jgi:hypothetical protein